jgi:hypothetical protein
MSVKVAVFKKLSPLEDYACSVLEIKEWSKGLADLRIEFGSQKNFQLNPRCNQKPKFQGKVILSIAIDSQLKPSLLFYPIAMSQYPEQAKKEFREVVLEELKQWLSEKMMQRETEIIGHELIAIELQGGHFKTHLLRYL